MQTRSQSVSAMAAAVLTGLMLTGAFPKIGLSWLAWVALVPLLVCLGRLSAQRSFRLGFLAGLVHFLTLCYWLVDTMQAYGGLPVYLSVPILFLLASYLALFVGVFALGVNWLCPTPGSCILMIPCIWTALEYIRSFLFTGFPWELLGYAHYDRLHLIQISDIFGVYGVSFLTVLVNSAAALLILFLVGKKWQGVGIGAALCLGALVSAAVAVGLTWQYGNLQLRAVDRLAEKAPKVRAAVVQGNIAQGVKWNPAFKAATISKYLALSAQAAADDADLVVWPETAAPFYFLYDSSLTEMVRQGAIENRVDFVVGSPSFNIDGGVASYYNSAYLVDAQGEIRARYDKAHLVPFGEYVPFKRYMPFLGKIVAQVGDFRTGEKGRTLPFREHALGLLICYEIIFPDLARKMADNGAGLLVNITNDAWYGRSSAPFQHFSMAVFRAVENRRALIRSANTGISGFIDPAGRIVALTELFVEKVVTENTPVLKEKTFYTAHGDFFSFGCVLLVIAAGLWRGLSGIVKRR